MEFIYYFSIIRRIFKSYSTLILIILLDFLFLATHQTLLACVSKNKQEWVYIWDKVVFCCLFFSFPKRTWINFFRFFFFNFTSFLGIYLNISSWCCIMNRVCKTDISYFILNSVKVKCFLSMCSKIHINNSLIHSFLQLWMHFS